MRLAPRLSLYLLATAQLEPFARARFRRQALRNAASECRTAERAGLSNEVRPDGQVLWVHAGGSTELGSAEALIQKLAGERPDISVLFTSEHLAPASMPVQVVSQARPIEGRSAARRFLAHWRPSVALWLGNPVYPALAKEMHRAGVPAILADVAAARDGPFGLGAEHVLGAFDHVLARSRADARHLRRASDPASKVEAWSPVREGPAPPPCHAGKLDALARATAGRPIWLAFGVCGDELASIFAAHAGVSQSSHRSLMLVIPSARLSAEEVAASSRRAKWVTATRSQGGEPSETVQVLIGDVAGEEGIFLRLAPITFLGSSLAPSAGGTDPWAPAALGSAILHGPSVELHRHSYRRLSSVGAAREVTSAEDLEAAVSDLQSPDQAAAMANAAWAVHSEGAEVSDRIMTLVLGLLDKID